jgi:hypothetical protein
MAVRTSAGRASWLDRVGIVRRVCCLCFDENSEPSRVDKPRAAGKRHFSQIREKWGHHRLEVWENWTNRRKGLSVENKLTLRLWGKAFSLGISFYRTGPHRGGN